MAPEATKVKVGDLAPTLALPTLGGGPSGTAVFRGRPILLFFFKSACRLCREEIGAIERVNRRYRLRDLVVLGVSVDVETDALQQLVNEKQVTFIVMQDPDAQVLRATFGSYKMPEAY